MLVLNHTLDQMDLKDIYRTFHPMEGQYVFFSSAHRAFSRTAHMMGHKTYIVRFEPS